MADSRLDYANEYPVEITGPDISPYKKGNTGIDYIHTFDSKKPGPHVLVSAVVHGNEPWSYCYRLVYETKSPTNPRKVVLSIYEC